MSWEQRKSKIGCYGRYYTRSKRTANGRVRTYLGSGPDAEAAAIADAQLQIGRREAVAACNAEQARWRSTSDRVDQVCAMITLATNAALLTAGLHNNHGDWSRCYEKD
jgi:hypothetical protein